MNAASTQQSSSPNLARRNASLTPAPRVVRIRRGAAAMRARLWSILLRGLRRRLLGCVALGGLRVLGCLSALWRAWLRFGRRLFGRRGLGDLSYFLRHQIAGDVEQALPVAVQLRPGN